MNIIHSIWTKPMLKGKERWNIPNQIEKHLWLFGYSVDYCNRIGLAIDLHTDSYGATVFDCLPYNKIHITLDTISDVNERFWSAGKVEALRVSALNTLHIDGDVFLKKKEIIPMLSMKDFDCIVQMEERNKIFMDSYSNVLPMFKDAGITELNYELKTALNAGIIGFSNQQLKDLFIDGYFKMIDKCQSDQTFMSVLKYDVEKKIEPNVVLEQYFLKVLCQDNIFKIKNLLEVKSDNFDDDIQDVNRRSNEIGFAHAWGISKLQIIEPIKQILSERNPRLYSIINQRIDELKNI